MQGLMLAAEMLVTPGDRVVTIEPKLVLRRGVLLTVTAKAICGSATPQAFDRLEPVFSA